jgi:hypothetical protein
MTTVAVRPSEAQAAYTQALAELAHAFTTRSRSAAETRLLSANATLATQTRAIAAYRALLAVAIDRLSSNTSYAHRQKRAAFLRRREAEIWMEPRQ